MLDGEKSVASHPQSLQNPFFIPWLGFPDLRGGCLCWLQWQMDPAPWKMGPLTLRCGFWSPSVCRAFPRGCLSGCGQHMAVELLSDLALLSPPLLSMAAGFAGSCWIYLFHAVLQMLAGSVGLPSFLWGSLGTWGSGAAPGWDQQPQSCCNTSSAGAGGDIRVTGCGCHSPAHTWFVVFRTVLSTGCYPAVSGFPIPKRFPGM